MRKLAHLPVSKLPTALETPNNEAGVVVNASNAFSSDSPFCIAFFKLGMNWLTSFNPLAVKANGIPAFSKAAGFVGANSQCFKSETLTNRASFGSSTSIACGKLRGKIKDDLIALISSMRWYSFPPALKMY